VRAPGYGGSPGALGCRSGSPPIPAETLLENTLSHPSLTVSFRPQVSKLFAHAGGRSVLRWYPPGLKLIFHNSLSVPIQSRTQFYTASQFGRGDTLIVPVIIREEKS
jgi:hypothetical protein